MTFFKYAISIMVTLFKKCNYKTNWRRDHKNSLKKLCAMIQFLSKKEVKSKVKYFNGPTQTNKLWTQQCLQLSSQLSIGVLPASTAGWKSPFSSHLPLLHLEPGRVLTRSSTGSSFGEFLNSESLFRICCLGKFYGTKKRM